MTASGLNPEKAVGHREHRESGLGRDGQFFAQLAKHKRVNGKPGQLLGESTKDLESLSLSVFSVA